MGSETKSVKYTYADVVAKIELLSQGDEVSIDESEIAFALSEARRRNDGDVIFAIAEDWYQLAKNDDATYVSLLPAAADGGSVRANYWLAKEYRLGKNLPRDFVKAYAHYSIYTERNRGSWDFWSPIDPEQNCETMGVLKEYGIGILEMCNPGMVASILLDTDEPEQKIEDSIAWWEFVLEKHPSRALKCGLGNWYVKVGEFAKGVGLIEESANEEFRDAHCMLAIYYAGDAHKDVEKAIHWLSEAEKRGANLSHIAKRLNVECAAIQRLKDEAEKGNLSAAAQLAVAYFHGGAYGEHGEANFCCDRDDALARKYGVQACTEESGAKLLFDLLDMEKREDCIFLNELTKDLPVDEPCPIKRSRCDDNELLQDEEGNWMYRGDVNP